MGHTEATLGTKFPSSRRYWAVLLAVAMVATLIGLVVFSLGTHGQGEATSDPAADGSRTKRSAHGPEQKPFSFDDIWTADFQEREYSGSWHGDGNDLLRKDSSGNLISENVVTGVNRTLVPKSIFDSEQPASYWVSPSQYHVLLALDRQKVWRHSFLARYKIYDVTAGELKDFPNDDNLKDNKLQLAKWSQSGHSLSFVYGNNLYLQIGPKADPQQVTFDGDSTIIYNGLASWLYEEDVIFTSNAHYWSKDGSYLVYARFNTTGVPTMRFPIYGPKTDLYPSIYEVAYPKAGDVRADQAGPNPTVELYVISTANPTQPKRIEPPNNLKTQEHYYTRVRWMKDGVYIMWTNRVMNWGMSTVCDPIFANCTEVLEHTEPNGYIDVQDAAELFTDAGEILTIYPQAVAGVGRWPHLAVVNQQQPGDPTFLTSGTEEVISIRAYDSANGWVYYMSTGGDPKERHLYRVKMTDSSDKKCLTCGRGDGCRFTWASFSGSAEYMLLTCQGPDPSVTYIKKSDDLTGSETVVFNNDQLKSKLAKTATVTREFFQMDIGAGYKAEAELRFPPNFDPTKKYRFITYVYGGPNSQAVTKRSLTGNSNNWLQSLCTEHDILILRVDGRGTAGRGNDYRFLLYKKLSTYEIDDQIIAATNLRKRSYIDASAPAAIFGWSYGGHVSSLALADSNTPKEGYQCAAAVAPTTSKLYYDTAYTEKYMGLATSDDNAAGYAKTDVMSKASKFKNKTYLIAHGTADDNVHFMHFTQLVRALEEEEVMFRQLVYPDEQHGISSPLLNKHLYASMTNFLLNDCWKKADGNGTSGGHVTSASVLVSAVSVMVTVMIGNTFIA